MDSKEEDKGNKILIHVEFNGQQTGFKVDKFTKLRKLIKRFCEMKRIDSTMVRFLFDGARISEEKTPDELELTSGDVIEVMQDQVGGGKK